MIKRIAIVLSLVVEGPRDFFFKDFDAQMTFVVDANGRATGLVHHQNGADHPAKRIEGEPPPRTGHRAALAVG